MYCFHILQLYRVCFIQWVIHFRVVRAWCPQLRMLCPRLCVIKVHRVRYSTLRCIVARRAARPAARRGRRGVRTVQLYRSPRVASARHGVYSMKLGYLIKYGFICKALPSTYRTPFPCALQRREAEARRLVLSPGVRVRAMPGPTFRGVKLPNSTAVDRRSVDSTTALFRHMLQEPTCSSANRDRAGGAGPVQAGGSGLTPDHLITAAHMYAACKAV